MTRREEIIRELLEQHAELTDPMRAGNGGNKIGLLLMPHDPSCHTHTHTPPVCTCWRRGILELERLLTQMRDERKSQWWHVTERYLRCTHQTREIGYLRGRWIGLQPHEAVVSVPGGWTLTLAQERQKHKHTPLRVRVQIATWSPAVWQQKVTLGVEWIADRWNLTVEPMLPVEKQAA